MPEPKPFAVAPREAIDFLKQKMRVPTAHWTDVWEKMHSRAFMVAGAQSEDLLKDFHEAVTKAIETGGTLGQFREDFDRIVAEHGWSYNGSRGWRSRIIFQTNLRMAYAAGRWQQIQRVKEQRPYLRYVHVDPELNDKNSRPEHAAWHNTVLPVDDPFWDTHFPPNDWECRCTVQSLNERDLERYGLEVSDRAPVSELVERVIKTRDGDKKTVQVPKGIGPGFAYRPGAMPDLE